MSWSRAGRVLLVVGLLSGLVEKGVKHGSVTFDETKREMISCQ